MKKNLRSAFNTRQYMVSRDFELFYYSDIGLNTLSMHSHDYYEFYLFLEGDVSIEIKSPDNNIIKKVLNPGDLILIPPGIEHHSIIQNSDAPYRRFVFWISREYCERLIEDSVDYVYLFQQATSFKQYYFPLGPADYHLTVSKLLRLLEETHSDIILTLNRVIYDERNHLEMGEEVSLFQNLISYIEANIEQPLSLESLAREFYVSKFYISHLFKDTLGISPHQYILKKRLSLCRDTIVSGTSISSAYERYGFRDYSSFFKAFKKEYGLSPKEYQTLYSVIKANP